MQNEVFYEIELRFMWNLFEKCHLQMVLLESDREPDRQVDLRLRERLGMPGEYKRLMDIFRQIVRPGTLYRMTDAFLCSYLLLELPEREERTFLSVGPYLAVEMNRNQLLEQAERLGLSEDGTAVLEHHYATMPQMTEQAVYAPLETFCERLWGRDGYTMVDVNQELYQTEAPVLTAIPRETPEETLRKMEEMERRYAYENELMRAVSLGLTQRGEMLLTSFSSFAFERRLADPVRNLKNYAIIMNTLLRKAAEQGGVHPLYLDNRSSEYARKIEQITSDAAGYSLMMDMYRGYCRLVRLHATGNYSLPVRKAIAHIDSDLNGELSLKTLAELQDINASYLSTLFKKETGQTLTDYVNQRRMQLAVQLLGGTNLQIQTVAQHCGIPDVNYFTKVFKKYVGKTPKQFRQDSMYMAQEPAQG